MHRIDTDTAQVDKFGAGKNGFTGGNPQTGRLPTALDEDFFDAVQEEISRVVEAAGLSLEKREYGQLLQALGMLYAPLGGLKSKQDKNDNLTALSELPGDVNGLPYFTGNQSMAMAVLSAVGRGFIGQSSVANMLTYLGGLKTTNYLSEIAAAGVAAQKSALINLGIGEAAKMPASTAISSTGSNLIVNIPVYVSGVLKYLTIQMFSVAASSIGNSVYINFSFPVAYPDVPFAMVSDTVGQISGNSEDDGLELSALTATGGTIYSAWSSRAAGSAVVRVLVMGVRDNV